MKNFTIPAARSGWFAAIVIGALLMDHVAPHAVADVLHWEVTGRVAEVSDPDAIFGDVAINDPVRGYFCYDTSLQPEDFFFGLAFYRGECSPIGPVMVVENPRENSELTISLPVDGQDFLIWQRGDSPRPLDAADLADWEAHFGSGPSNLVTGSSALPEPATWMLLALGTTAVMFRRIVVASRFTDLHERGYNRRRNGRILMETTACDIRS